MWNNGYLNKWQKDEIRYIVDRSWIFYCCQSFESFINSLSSWYYTAFFLLDKKLLFQKSNLLFAYINLLPRDIQKKYPNKKYWLHSSLEYYFWWYRYNFKLEGMWLFSLQKNFHSCEKCPK